MISETISAKGRVYLEVQDKHGNVLEVFDEPNLIVNVGKQSLASLLGAATSSKRVTKIGFGTSSTPPASGQTSITSGFVKALGGVSYSGNSVIFDYTLEVDEANSTALREFALFSDDDTMFSRITRSVIIKTSDIRLVGTWTITF